MGMLQFDTDLSKLDAIALYVLLGIICVIAMPGLVYCWYLYITNHSSLFFVKRRRILIILPLILITFAIFVEEPMEILHDLGMITDQSWWDKYLFLAPEGCLHLVWLILAMRVHFLWFDHRYQLAISHQTWRNLINPKDPKYTKYTRRHQTRGSMASALGVVFFVWITIMCFDIFFHLIYQLSWVVTCLEWCYLLGLSAWMYLYWRKFPDALDSLHIRSELKYIWITFCVSFVTFGVALIFYHGNVHSSSDWPFQYIQTISYMVWFYLTTAYVVTKNRQFTTEHKKRQRVHKLREIQRKARDNDSVNPGDGIVKLDIGDEKMAAPIASIKPGRLTMAEKRDIVTQVYLNPRFGWKELVSTNEGYEAFITYLSSQFCAENLLFVTEYVQLKRIRSRSIFAKDPRRSSARTQSTDEAPLNLSSPLSPLNPPLEAKNLDPNSTPVLESTVDKEKETIQLMTIDFGGMSQKNKLQAVSEMKAMESDDEKEIELKLADQCTPSQSRPVYQPPRADTFNLDKPPTLHSLSPNIIRLDTFSSNSLNPNSKHKIKKSWSSIHVKNLKDEGPFEMLIPPIVPLSSTCVYPGVEGALKLYEKYIEPGKAPLEINISYRLRKQCTEILKVSFFQHLTSIFRNFSIGGSSMGDPSIGSRGPRGSKSSGRTHLTDNPLSAPLQTDEFEEVTVLDIFELFDRAAHEIARLLRDSFIQFKQTQRFEKLCSQCAKQYHWDDWTCDPTFS